MFEESKEDDLYFVLDISKREQVISFKIVFKISIEFQCGRKISEAFE